MNQQQCSFTDRALGCSYLKVTLNAISSSTGDRGNSLARSSSVSSTEDTDAHYVVKLSDYNFLHAVDFSQFWSGRMHKESSLIETTINKINRQD